MRAFYGVYSHTHTHPVSRFGFPHYLVTPGTVGMCHRFFTESVEKFPLTASRELRMARAKGFRRT